MPTVLVFDIGSSFGYFRKAFTTTSALTHSVIPRSTIEGLIGAILGYSSDHYPDRLQSSKIAVQIMSPVRKMNMKYMHTNPDWWQNVSHYLEGKTISKYVQFAVPASVEFLVNPRYRVYIDCEVNRDLSKTLRNKQAYYTPFLGTSSMFSSVNFMGEFGYRIVSSTINDHLPVSSIIPFSDKMPRIKLEKGSTFAIEEGLPIHVDNQRKSHGTYKVIYGPEPPGTLLIIDKDITELQIGGKGPLYVKFLPTQITS